MKVYRVVNLMLAIAGALIAVNSTDIYTTNMVGLIIGSLLMLPGLCSAIHDLWLLQNKSKKTIDKVKQVRYTKDNQ